MERCILSQLFATRAGGERRERSLGRGVAQPFNLGRLARWKTSLSSDSQLARQIAESGLEPFLTKAIDDLAASRIWKDAQSAADENIGKAAGVRAVVAMALFLAHEKEVPSPARVDAALRDAIVEELQALLGGQTRSIADGVRGISRAILKPVAGFALGRATNCARRRRGALSDSTAGPAGDILLYQARGAGIRGFIENEVNNCSRPVALLAHSLGGIACVDLLILRELPQVKILITCGSQAPLFYELGALQSLEFTDVPDSQRLPATFPRWLNFYDPRDFLSYVAAPLFKNGRVEDVRVDNRLAFPESHSGYWRNPSVWKRVRAALAEIGE